MTDTDEFTSEAEMWAWIKQDMQNHLEEIHAENEAKMGTWIECLEANPDASHAERLAYLDTLYPERPQERAFEAWDQQWPDASEKDRWDAWDELCPTVPWDLNTYDRQKVNEQEQEFADWDEQNPEATNAERRIAWRDLVPGDENGLDSYNAEER